MEISWENPVPDSVSYRYFRYYIEPVQDYHFSATDHTWIENGKYYIRMGLIEEIQLGTSSENYLQSPSF